MVSALSDEEAVSEADCGRGKVEPLNYLRDRPLVCRVRNSLNMLLALPVRGAVREAGLRGRELINELLTQDTSGAKGSIGVRYAVCDEAIAFP